MTTTVLITATVGNKKIKITTQTEKVTGSPASPKLISIWSNTASVEINPPTWKNGNEVEPGQSQEVLVHSGTRYIIEEIGPFIS